MLNTPEEKGFEVHDQDILMRVRKILGPIKSAKDMANAILKSVHRNDDWSGKRRINLLEL